LQSLRVHTAENHRADSTIANGQRFVPIRRGLAIPQPQRFGSSHINEKRQ
jgi:hypothetical protein